MNVYENIGCEAKMLNTAIFITGVCVALPYLVLTNKSVSWPRSIVKTIPVTVFALVAYLETAPMLLVVAFILSAVGDLSLSRPGTKWFLAGMIAFALAHLGFIGVMLASGAVLQQASGLLIAAMLILGASTEIWLRPHTAELKWPVRGYVIIILAMGLTAAGLPDDRQLAFWGAMLFVISDLILSIEIFVLPDDHKMRKIAAWDVWVCYIAAQAFLLWGLLS